VATASVVNVDDARVAYGLHGRGPAVVLVNGTAALGCALGPGDRGAQ
jgi:3-oxoadipate enol-lactonase